ncbi:MAG: ATP-binding cassette domain-containing protein [Bacteroidaceae bacterium]|nr:ATP-binding cassette domain-containing protein [Bacteroidaceae bacterium]
MQKTIEIQNGVVRHPLYRFKTPINLSISQGEQVAIVGDNGSGKSMLVDVLTEKHPLLLHRVHYDFSPSKSKLVSDNIKYISFRDSYGTIDSNYYLQQRWNQYDIEDAPVVGALLEDAFNLAEQAARRDSSLSEDDLHALTVDRTRLREHLYRLFHLDALLDKQIILLSSGELRKFHLTKTLLSNPRVLIIDNPFIGLDASTRSQLHELLSLLTHESWLQVILVFSKTDDIPTFITHVIPVSDMTVGCKISRAEYLESQQEPPSHVLDKEKEEQILSLPYSEGQDTAITPGSQQVIDFRRVNIRYGSHCILKDLSFTVMNGEHWALSGENGSGKSTLLSIVCADNPQAYANDIVLFGRTRGSGETIWDIKKHIGYISPEMHRAYRKDIPAVEIVASGLSDSIGLYKRPTAEELVVCKFWMEVFGVGGKVDTTFFKLSSGEQRLVLLARAFVKDPTLLILDEPLHGLDLKNRRLVKDIIETFCKRHNKTLIMVTHYEEELPAIIDHRIFLKRH